MLLISKIKKFFFKRQRALPYDNHKPILSAILPITIPTVSPIPVLRDV